MAVLAPRKCGVWVSDLARDLEKVHCLAQEDDIMTETQPCADPRGRAGYKTKSSRKAP